MRIEAAGKTWVVEEHELRGDSVGGERFYDISFRNEEDDGDLVQARWVVRPRSLTDGIARALFELAGERLWRDPRDGGVYRIELDSPPAGGEEEPATLVARFRSDEGSVTVLYESELPLGAASDERLMELLDRARRRPHGGDVGQRDVEGELGPRH